jgi:hypothetical protein
MYRWRQGGAFLAGCAVAGLIVGCGGSSSATVAPKPIAPSPSATPETVVSSDPEVACIWPEDLKFSGAFQFNVRKTDCVGRTPSCTGKDGASALSVHLPFIHEFDVYHNELWIDVHGFHGAGTYDGQATSVVVVNVDYLNRWQNISGDPVAFVVDSNLESGSLDATLTNNLPGNLRALKVSGKWTCRATTG